MPNAKSRAPTIESNDNINILGEEKMEHIEFLKKQELFTVDKIKPIIQIGMDGDQHFVLCGENLQEGVAGFGDTLYLAIVDFNKKFYEKLFAKPITFEGFANKEIINSSTNHYFTPISKIIEETNAGNSDCPIPIDVIPNRMGINLCSVNGIGYGKNNQGELEYLIIHFNPSK